METTSEQKQAKNLRESIGNRKVVDPLAQAYAESVGRKDDAGKLPYELLPFSVIDSISAVQRYGVKKYGANTWQKVPNGKKRYIAAALRHISDHQKGKRYDESGETHLSHALCSLMYAEWFDQQHVKRHKK